MGVGAEQTIGQHGTGNVEESGMILGDGEMRQAVDIDTIDIVKLRSQHPIYSSSSSG